MNNPLPMYCVRSAAIVIVPLLIFKQAGLAQTQVVLPALKDNTVYEEPGGNLSNGAGTHFFVGRTGQFSGSIRRGLLAFDIAGTIPAGATITAASLTLNLSKTNSGAQTLDLHRLLADWGEGTSVAGGQEGGGGTSAPDDATWLHTFYNSLFWTNPGGDFAATPSASQSVNATGQYAWASTAQMVSDVQDWLDNPASNFGWIVLGNEATGNTAKRFDTREHPLSANRPKLTVTYTPAQANVGVPINQGWNLISNPVTRNPGTDSVRHLYPNSINPYAVVYVPGLGYQQRQVMANGPGFWGKFPAPETNTITGAVLTLDSIAVVAGWNLVGSITFPVDTATITSVPPGILASAWYGYTGAYGAVAQLAPGKAFWVKASAPGKFVFSAAGPSPDRQP